MGTCTISDADNLARAARSVAAKFEALAEHIRGIEAHCYDEGANRAAIIARLQTLDESADRAALVDGRLAKATGA